MNHAATSVTMVVAAISTTTSPPGTPRFTITGAGAADDDASVVSTPAAVATRTLGVTFSPTLSRTSSGSASGNDSSRPSAAFSGFVVSRVGSIIAKNFSAAGSSG